MNVFATDIAAGNDSQKINYSLDMKKIDLSIGAGSGFDKVTFDSLLMSLKSETIDRSPASRKDYHAERAKRNQEYSDKNTVIDNRSDNRRSDESYRAQEKSDKNIDVGNREEAYRSEAAKQKTDQTDDNAKVEYKENSIDSDAINKGSEQSGDLKEKENGEGNAFKVGALLFELANTKAGELINAAETSEGGEAVLTEADQKSGQGLKNGALLYNLLQGKSDETVVNTLNSGKEAQGQAGDLLKDLINAKISEDGKPRVDEAVKGVSTEDMKLGNGLKAGELLKTAADVKTEGIEKELASAGANKVNADSEDTETEIDELIKKLDKNFTTDKKAEIRQEQIKENKLQDFMAQKDIQEANNAKAGVSKVLPGMVENLFRESGARPNVNTVTKTTSENADSNNVSTANDISVKGNGAKINVVNQTGNISKPTAFADVVNKIVYVAKGDNKLGITLDHKDLGQLNIKLTLEKGVVNIHINTADKVAREFVESNMQQIVESLSKNGVSVGGFSVGLKNHQGSEGYTNGNSNRDEKAFSPDGVQKQEYVKASANAYAGNSQVSIFA